MHFSSRKLLVATGLVLAACTGQAEDLESSTQELGAGQLQGAYTFPTSLPLTVLYEGDDGVTHFRTDQIQLTPGTAPTGEPTAGSPTYTATTAKAILHAPHFGCLVEDPHAVTAKRFVTILHGKFRITAGDGEERILKKGDIAQLLDIAPSKGHLGCALGNEPLLLFFTNIP